MENTTDFIGAWAHFWDWIRNSAQWSDGTLSRREKQYIHKAEIARREGKLGAKRIKAILNKYAPGKYEFRETVIFHDEK